MKKRIETILTGLLLIETVFAIFILLKVRLHDISFPNYLVDDELVLEKVSKKKPVPAGRGREYVTFTPKSEYALFDEVQRNPYYIYSVKQGNKVKNEVAPTYIFNQNGVYYYIASNISDGYYLADMFFSVHFDYYFVQKLIFPAQAFPAYYINLEKKEDGSFSEYIKWSEFLFVSSFEDLEEFYKRTDSNTYSIDRDQKCIYLKGYDRSDFAKNKNEGKWSDKFAFLITTDDGGITITLLDDFYQKQKELYQGIMNPGTE